MYEPKMTPPFLTHLLNYLLNQVEKNHDILQEAYWYSYTSLIIIGLKNNNFYDETITYVFAWLIIQNSITTTKQKKRSAMIFIHQAELQKQIKKKKKKEKH